jgi:hypothetical protein
MATPASVTQKLATAKSMQWDTTNLSDFQTWLGLVPTTASQYAGQQYAIAGNDPGTLFIRNPGYPIILLNNTDWFVVPDDSAVWYQMTDQDYHKSWV